jgi:hypothetical protein
LNGSLKLPPLPRPITIPQVMVLPTLTDVRKLLGHIPKERRQLHHRCPMLATFESGYHEANLKTLATKSSIGLGRWHNITAGVSLAAQ